MSPLHSQLKQARIDKKLSQKALSERLGMPQSHLSKIENGKTDLRVSSLIELARILGLEPMLIPKKNLPAIQAILQGISTAGPRWQLDEPL